ncbi:hypothetical protein NDU88_000342 [Pleurodeles waltl]|uniref:Uncharacterized protein n=1 Tax=Pleurodeles waltl TaxID=8319 RepID=A0AAV7SWR3_PLEWA|nr:hypothetical protein NDU88_000342 [Pleurodeles waltl]
MSHGTAWRIWTGRDALSKGHMVQPGIYGLSKTLALEVTWDSLASLDWARHSLSTWDSLASLDWVRHSSRHGVAWHLWTGRDALAKGHLGQPGIYGLSKTLALEVTRDRLASLDWARHLLSTWVSLASLDWVRHSLSTWDSLASLDQERLAL